MPTISEIRQPRFVQQQIDTNNDGRTDLTRTLRPATAAELAAAPAMIAGPVDGFVDLVENHNTGKVASRLTTFPADMAAAAWARFTGDRT